MKKKILLLLSLSLFIVMTGFASIVHMDYGAGLAFNVDEPGTLDLNFDGEADLQISNTDGLLGLTPITWTACLGANFDDIGGLGSIRTYEEGEEVNTDDPYNDYDYMPLIDDNGAIDGWNDQEEKYIGFLDFNNYSTGWIKLKIDITTQTLYVMSFAYENEYNVTINAGELGEAGPTGIEDVIDVNSLKVFPNPASNYLQINLEIVKSTAVEFNLMNTNGQLILAERKILNAGAHQERLNIQQLPVGNYQLIIRSDGDISTHHVIIIK